MCAVFTYAVARLDVCTHPVHMVMATTSATCTPHMNWLHTCIPCHMQTAFCKGDVIWSQKDSHTK